METGTVQINSAPARGPDHFPFQVNFPSHFQDLLVDFVVLSSIVYSHQLKYLSEFWCDQLKNLSEFWIHTAFLLSMNGSEQLHWKGAKT
jgi:hypothetical protein